MVSDLVTLPGLINLDFADVRTIMTDAGQALLGIGMASGERRAVEAAEQAVSSPLLETSVEGARSILLSITGGRDLSLWEVNEAAKAVSEAAHPSANIIFGAMVDDKVDDEWLGDGRGDWLMGSMDPALEREARAGAGRRASDQARRAARPLARLPTSRNSSPAARPLSRWATVRAREATGAPPRASRLGLDAMATQRGVVAAGHPG